MSHGYRLRQDGLQPASTALERERRLRILSPFRHVSAALAQLPSFLSSNGRGCDRICPTARILDRFFIVRYGRCRIFHVESSSEFPSRHTCRIIFGLAAIPSFSCKFDSLVVAVTLLQSRYAD